MKTYAGLTPKQEAVLTAVLTEVTNEQAAKKAGVSIATLWRYMQIPAFRAAYLQARRQIVEDAIALLQRASKKAVATLVENLECGSPSAEVTSARIILEQSFKGVELMEMGERIRQLEEFQQEEQERKSCEE